MPIPDKIERAFAAPDGAYAVVTGAEGTAVVSWTGGDVRSVRLDDAVVPAGVSWSGDTFAIYSADGVVQIWRDGKLTETRSTEPGTEVSLCADGRLALGVCGRDGDYSIDTSGLMRTRDGKRELIAEGVFKAVAAHAGFIVAAGSELLVWHGADARRLALPTIAVAVQPMRTPGVFAVALDDGSLWVYSDGELQLMQGGRR